MFGNNLFSIIKMILWWYSLRIFFKIFSEFLINNQDPPMVFLQNPINFKILNRFQESRIKYSGNQSEFWKSNQNQLPSLGFTLSASIFSRIRSGDLIKILKTNQNPYFFQILKSFESARWYYSRIWIKFWIFTSLII